MPYGVWVADADSNVMLDTSSSLGRVIDTVTIAGTNGSYTVPTSIQNRIGVAIFQVLSTGMVPVFSISGRVISWQYSTSVIITVPKASVVAAILGY